MSGLVLGTLYYHFISSSQQPCKVGIIFLILPMRKQGSARLDGESKGTS